MVNRNHSPSEEELKAFSTELKAQYDLEKWWVEDIKARDVEHNELLRKTGSATSDKAIQKWVITLAQDLADEIDERLNRLEDRTRRGMLSRNSMIIKNILTSSKMQTYELAYLILATAVNGVLGSNKGFITIQSMLTVLADALEQEVRLRAMQEIEPELQGIVNKVLKDSRSSIKHRRRTFINLFHKRTEARIPWMYGTNEAKIKVGKALVELLTSAPGAMIVHAEKSYMTKKRDLQWTIKPSQKLLDLFYRNMDLGWLARRSQALGIMLSEPNRHIGGGFPEMLMTKDVEPIKVSALSGKRGRRIAELNHMQDNGYETLVDTVSYLERIPFRINRVMLEYIQSNKSELQALGVLSSAQINIPGCPVQKDKDREEMTPEELAKLREWKRVAKKEYDNYWSSRLMVAKQNRTLTLARKLSEYERFYYRWYADFRGRLYPLNTLLHFQSSPMGKALLEFAEQGEVQVGNPSCKGWQELVEYGLRLEKTFAKQTEGQLRPTLTDRQWLKANIAFIKEQGPSEEGVKRKDWLPWVAWSLEMTFLLDRWDTKQMSGHPVRRDATCSSMQHMAALCGDERVLKLTNCAPDQDKVWDLYPELVPDHKEQGFEREDIKKFIMTYAYNSTDYTRKRDLRESYNEKFGVPLTKLQAKDINDRLKAAIHRGLGKITKLQSLLMEVFRELVIKDKLEALSCTPAGLVVDSTKMEWPHRDFEIKTFEARLRFKMKDVDAANPRVDGRRTRQSWVANLIHSMDACLLHIFIVGCLNHQEKTGRTVHLAGIHDCVVTRPGDMHLAMIGLSAAFQTMYSPANSGMPLALDKLVTFWGLAENQPSLYNEFKDSCKAMPEGFYERMRYFFV